MAITTITTISTTTTTTTTTTTITTTLESQSQKQSQQNHNRNLNHKQPTKVSHGRKPESYQQIINRPGVAGAVLHTPLLLIN